MNLVETWQKSTAYMLECLLFSSLLFTPPYIIQYDNLNFSMRLSFYIVPKLLSHGKQVGLFKKSSAFTPYLKFEKKEKDGD